MHKLPTRHPIERSLKISAPRRLRCDHRRTKSDVKVDQTKTRKSRGLERGAITGILIGSVFDYLTPVHRAAVGRSGAAAIARGVRLGARRQNARGLQITMTCSPQPQGEGEKHSKKFTAGGH